MPANPVGVISMQFVRPFTSRDLGLMARVRELGFDFIELLVPEPEDELDLADVRRAADDQGLAILLAARVTLVRDVSSADAHARRGGLEYLLGCVRTAEALGARVVGGPLYGGPLVFAGRAPAAVAEDERSARLSRCVEALSTVADTARAAGVRLAVEPLNRFETDIVSTVSQGIELVDAVASPALGLLLDTFHMNIEERSIAQAIRVAGRRIAHFQANENHRGYPGTGHLDWLAIGRALRDVGYAGPVSLEPFRREDERFAVPLAQWRPPDGDDADKLLASLALVRSALDTTPPL